MTPERAEALLSPADQEAALELFYAAVDPPRRRRNPPAPHPALVALIGEEEAQRVAHLNPSALSQLTLTGLQAKGLSKRAAQCVRAAFVFAEAAVRESPSEDVSIRGPQDVDALMRPRLALRHAEEFWVIYTNSRGRVIHLELAATSGSVDAVQVDPRSVLRRALELGAVGLILVHNHPSADPQPSEPDRKMTREMGMSARHLGLKLSDHVIIGRPGFTSLASLGLVS